MKFMTQRLTGLLALAMLGYPLAASAQDAKIGFVDREKALFSTEAGKKARDELQAKLKAAQAQLAPLADKQKALAGEIEAKKFVLAPEALMNIRAQLAEVQNQLENKGKELEGQLKIDQVRLVSPLEEKLKTAIEAVGKEQGYSLILERNVPQLIYYSREQHDITDAVVARFNAAK